MGRVASHFYIAHRSITLFNERLRPHMGEADVLSMVAESSGERGVGVGGAPTSPCPSRRGPVRQAPPAELLLANALTSTPPLPTHPPVHPPTHPHRV